MNKLEEISAFMDGESGQSAETVLASFKTDSELLASWRRYHLIGDAMRGRLSADMPITDLTQRVATALENEPTVLTPQARPKTVVQRALKPAASIAIAASVALVAIVGLRGLDQATNLSNSASPDAVADMTTNGAPAKVNTFANEPASSSQAPLARTVSTGTEPISDYREGEYGFSSYLINHNEYRTKAGAGGSLPYARIVAPNDSDR